MESSCISAYNTIQPSYMREAPSTLSASAYFDCDNYPSPNLDDTYWGNLIPSIPASFCNTPMETGSQQEQVVAKDEDPEFKELADQVLDMENVYGRKLSSLGQNIPDSFCNTPMETGSQQEQVVAKDEDPEFQELSDQVLDMENVYGRKLSSLGQNIPDSFCNTPMETGSQQEQVVAKDEDPEFKELADQVLDMEDEKRESMYKTEEVNVYGRKLSSLGQNIPDSFCNTPMETGSQQTHSAWDVDCTGVEASKSAAYQSMNVLHEDRPMTTYDANMPLQSTTNVNPITQVYDQNKRQNQTVVSGDLDFVNQITPLFNATPSNAPYVYGVLPATGEQNIPELCNTPMETGSQQTSSAWYVDHTGVEASKSAAYQSMNVLHDDTPITTDNQQTECYTPIATGSQQEQVVDPECKKCYQRAKQLRKRYKSAFQTIGKEQPLKSLYRSRQIAPCLGECRRTPNVSVLHHQNCVLYNMPILKELHKKYPKILRQVKKHFTDINIDRDDFKNLLFHEKLSKMLDKIECAVKYMESCFDKYMYLAAFNLQLTELVEGGRDSHHNPTMEEKIDDVDELTLDLMQKDMSYYQLKVDLNNMLELMSKHKYAEVVEMYYNLLKLESRIDTFIENYKKVPESIKEKLDIQNNYTDCESISFYYKDYNEYLNLLINSLDETNSVPDNNSVFEADPIISNPDLKVFYKKMDKSSYDKLYRDNKKLRKLTTKKSDIICLFMKDLSRLLDAIEELHVTIENMLDIDILRNREQSSKQPDDDVYWFKDSLENARHKILYGHSEINRTYLSVKELGRMEMKKTWVYINTKVPIQKYSLSCMRACMVFSLLRGDKACKTVKENLSSTLFKKLGSKFQFLKEYIDYQENLIDVLKATWFAPVDHV